METKNGITILEKVANEHSFLHNMCGGTFLKAIYDLYVTTEGVMDNEVAKSFLQLFADVNDIDWKDAVEYLYYIMTEAFPKFYEENSICMKWESISSESNDAYGNFLKIKDNKKYASKQLFELFCARANINVEDCIREFVMDAYGWKRVIKALAMYVIEEYLSVEDRFEDMDEVGTNTEVDDSKIPQSRIKDIEESTTNVDGSSMYSVATEEQNKDSAIETLEESISMSELQGEAITSEIIPSSEVLGKYGMKAEKAICIDDGTSKILYSRKDMSTELGICYGCITNFYRGQRCYCKSKKNGKKYKFERMLPKKQEKTLMVDATTKEIVKYYTNTTDASREWGIDYNRLQGVLGNKTSEHHLIDGYEWWKESDYAKQYKKVT